MSQIQLRTEVPTVVYHQVYCKFEVKQWSDLSEGDRIWFRRKGHDDALGPFTVVDPASGRLRNDQGVELNFPNVEPLVFVDEMR